MNKKIIFILLTALLALGGILAFFRLAAPTLRLSPAVPLPPTISGTVVEDKGPVLNAIVQVQGTPNQTTTAENGAFTLNGITGTSPITITAWAEGHYIGWTMLDPNAPDWKGGSGISITLKPYYTTDNYQYMGFSFEGVTGSKSCGLCHREYEEWKADAHSQSAANPHFVTMYRGTDVNGHQSQPTRWDNNGAALPPDPSQPDFGPGFQLDNPQRAGNCATCHTPAAGKISNRQNCAWSGCHTGVTIERANGVIDHAVIPVSSSALASEGISCEFCHKIGDVTLDAKTKLPAPDMPGILSLRLFRPPEGQQLFFGTLVDVTRPDTYLPLESKSEFCAACHYGVMGGVMGNGTVTGGTLIYNSYGEWLDSPYSNPQTGKTCQDCHMPTVNTKFSAFPERGGIARDYSALHGHQMPGAYDETLLKNAVTLKNQATHVDNRLEVQVSITNDKTGHAVPTDATMRQMILVVEAFDAAGKSLTLNQGPVNPTWAGNYGGQAGKTFEKLLKDEWTGETPTAAFWRPTKIVQDTRLLPLATDTTGYAFELPAGRAAEVKVRLVFRRAFQSLMQVKGWTDPDVVMAEQVIQIEQ